MFIALLTIALIFVATNFAGKRIHKNAQINSILWSLLDPDYVKEQASLSQLATLGPAAYPYLTSAFRETYSLSERAYEVASSSLPAPLKNYFPARPSRRQLRRAVVANLYTLGPNASRALVPEVELALKKADDHESMALLQSLYWSIPESAHAVGILSNYLADPRPAKLLFGMSDAREIWARVPQLAPLLRPWLYYADTTAEAAEGLGLMGTNASFALPDLILLATTGCIPDPTIHSQYLKGGPIKLNRDRAERNRAAAVHALGNIGIATSQVFEVLKSAYIDPSEKIRMEAGVAFAAFGSKSLPELDFLVQNLDRSNSTVLQYQLHALGQIGPQATKAVPILLELSAFPQFSVLEDVGRAVPRGSPTGIHRSFLWHNEPKPGMVAASIALLKIDPHAARDRIDVLSLALRSIVPTNLVQALRPFKKELVSHLEPALHLGQPLGTLRPPFGPAGMPIHRIVVAHHLLVLETEHIGARTILQNALKDNAPQMRSVAAKWLYSATGETNTTLPIVKECLTHVKTEQDQFLISIIADFGEHARSLAPDLEPFLTHQDRSIRYAAGEALRSIGALERQ